MYTTRYIEATVRSIRYFQLLKNQVAVSSDKLVTNARPATEGTINNYVVTSRVILTKLNCKLDCIGV